VLQYVELIFGRRLARCCFFLNWDPLTLLDVVNACMKCRPDVTFVLYWNFAHRILRQLTTSHMRQFWDGATRSRPDCLGSKPVLRFGFWVLKRKKQNREILFLGFLEKRVSQDDAKSGAHTWFRTRQNKRTLQLLQPINNCVLDRQYNPYLRDMVI
jgi:hypothetical protein